MIPLNSSPALSKHAHIISLARGLRRVSEATCQALHCIVLFLRAFCNFTMTHFYLVPGFTKACTSFPRHEACGEF